MKMIANMNLALLLLLLPYQGVAQSCSEITKGGECRKASGCSWDGVACSDSAPSEPTGPTDPAPLPTGDSGCSIYTNSRNCNQNPPCEWAGKTDGCASDWGSIDTNWWNVDILFETQNPGDPRITEAYVLAKQKWESLIAGNVDPTIPGSSVGAGNDCSNPLPTTIDDIHICGRDVPIDGPGSVLGRAGPSYVRVGTGQTITGNMEFDTADVATLVDSGSWEDVILHEMGHIIGIGTLWEYAGVIGSLNRRTQSYPYYGVSATKVWNEEWGCSGEPPVETDGGGGTAGGHWDEVCLIDELMTGYLSGTSQPCSKLTAATLEDLGYGVDYTSNLLLDLSFDGSNVAASCCSGGRRQLRGPSYIEDISTLHKPPLSDEGMAIATAYGRQSLEEHKLPPGVPREANGVVYVGDLATTVYYQENGHVYDLTVTPPSIML